MIAPEEIEILTPGVVPKAETPGEGSCVLLAEDDPALRRYLEVVLQRSGYRVVGAADGLEAMKFLLTSTVDIVVTDAMMPNLSGYELCRFIRGSKHLSHLPVVLLSALDPKNSAAEAEQADVFLSKPVSPEQLVECLTALVAQAR